MTRVTLPVRCLLFLSCVALVTSWVFFGLHHHHHHHDNDAHQRSRQAQTERVERRRDVNEYCVSFYNKTCTNASASVFTLTKRSNDALMLQLINDTDIYHDCLSHSVTSSDRDDDDDDGERITLLDYAERAITEGLPFIVYVDVDKMLHRSRYVISINYDSSFCNIPNVLARESVNITAWQPFLQLCNDVTRASGGAVSSAAFARFEDGDNNNVNDDDQSFGYYKVNSLCTYEAGKESECLHAWWKRVLMKEYGDGVEIKFNFPLSLLNGMVATLQAGETNVHSLLYAYYYADAVQKGMSLCFYVAKFLNLPHINRAFYKRTQVPGAALQGVVEGIRRQIKRMTRGSKWLSWSGVQKIDAKMNNLAIFFLGQEVPKREYAPIYTTFRGGVTFRAWCREKERRRRERLKRDDYIGDRLVEGYEDDPYETEFDIVNAWYKPSRNSITIPPGILQPPIYHGEDEAMNRRVNYVYLSSVLAHEIGHAIDVHGLMFDEWGHYRGIKEDGSDGYRGAFTEADKMAFASMTQCLEKDYGNPCNRSDYGENTLGEDMADQVGVYVSHKYFREELTGMCSEFADEDRDRKCLKAFFYDYATIWCSDLTEEQKCRRVNTDVHALPADRVDKTLRQIKAFAKAFGCAEEDFMVDKGRCLIY